MPVTLSLSTVAQNCWLEEGGVRLFIKAITCKMSEEISHKHKKVARKPNRRAAADNMMERDMRANTKELAANGGEVREKMGASNKMSSMGKKTEKIDEFLLAASEGKASRLAAMIKQGMNVNVTDSLGWTALMIAVWDGHETCVQMLLNAGANIDARQEHGLTAAKLADSVGHPRMLELIESRGKASVAGMVKKTTFAKAAEKPKNGYKGQNSRENSADGKTVEASHRVGKRFGLK